MNHLISATEFFNCGLPVSDDITEEEVEFAVNTIEQYCLYPYFQDQLALIIDNPTTYASILNAPYGMKQMMYHLVFAYMIYDKVRLTRYSSVIKNDEHSTDPSMKDLLEICKMHWEVGRDFMRRCCLELELGWDGVCRNDFIFNELLY